MSTIWDKKADSRLISLDNARDKRKKTDHRQNYHGDLIVLTASNWHHVLDAILCKLSSSHQIFNRGSVLVCESIDGIRPVSDHWMCDLIDRYSPLGMEKEKGEIVPVRCPLELAKRLLAASDRWSPVSVIDGVSASSLMRSDGSIIESRGYDAKTKLFCLSNISKPIPDHPTLDDIKNAIDCLWKPISQFPYFAPEDVGAAFSMVLTSVQRTILDTSPAFVISAPVFGSGKTFLGQVASILSGGDGDVMAAPPSGEEAQKVILSALMSGNRPTILIDNISGSIRGDALAAAMTSRHFEGRLLGASQMIRVQNRSLWVFTGVNVSPSEDLVRRVITIRLDPQCENPESKKFDFHPLSLARDTRDEMRRSALIILRAANQSETKIEAGSLGSFEQWNQTIRKTVLWLIQNDLAPCEMSDPLKTQQREKQSDPEIEKLRSIIYGWKSIVGYSSGTWKDVVSQADSEYCAQAEEVQAFLITLEEICGSQKPNYRKLGWWSRRHAGRIVDGFKLVADKDTRTGGSWRVALSSDTLPEAEDNEIVDEVII